MHFANSLAIIICLVIAESDLSSTISGRSVVNGVGGEICTAFTRSPRHTSQTHVSPSAAFDCFGCYGGLPYLVSLAVLLPVGDTTSCTRDSGTYCFTLSPRCCVVLSMYLCPTCTGEKCSIVLFCFI